MIKLLFKSPPCQPFALDELRAVFIKRRIHRAVRKIMIAAWIIIFVIALIFYLIGYYVGGGIERHDCFEAAGFPPPPAFIYLSKGE